ncbi:hypothetical protein Droror1_Dr00026110 [Drosera rotundifolia]
MGFNLEATASRPHLPHSCEDLHVFLHSSSILNLHVFLFRLLLLLFIYFQSAASLTIYQIRKTKTRKLMLMIFYQQLALMRQSNTPCKCQNYRRLYHREQEYDPIIVRPSI